LSAHRGKPGPHRIEPSGHGELGSAGVGVAAAAGGADEAGGVGAEEETPPMGTAMGCTGVMEGEDGDLFARVEEEAAGDLGAAVEGWGKEMVESRWLLWDRRCSRGT